MSVVERWGGECKLSAPHTMVPLGALSRRLHLSVEACGDPQMQWSTCQQPWIYNRTTIRVWQKPCCESNSGTVGVRQHASACTASSAPGI